MSCGYWLGTANELRAVRHIKKRKAYGFPLTRDCIQSLACDFAMLLQGESTPSILMQFRIKFLGTIQVDLHEMEISTYLATARKNLVMCADFNSTSAVPVCKVNLFSNVLNKDIKITFQSEMKIYP